MNPSDAPIGQAAGTNDWDHLWDAFGEASLGNPANGYRQSLILRLLGRPPAGSTVLDIGSGQGQFALWLQAMYPDLAVWGCRQQRGGGVARSREFAAKRG